MAATIDIEEFGEIVGAIYDAALRPELWPDVVARITASLAGFAGMLFTPLNPSKLEGFSASAQLSSETIRRYVERYYALDVWTKAAVAKNLFKTGVVVSDEELLPHDELLETDYYKEFLRPADISRLCASAIFGAEDSSLPATVLSIYGGLSAPPFGAEAKGLLRLLIPHLSRSLGVMYRLRLADSRVAASLAALEEIERGVVLFGEAGQVLHYNRRAGKMLAAIDGLHLREVDGLQYLTTGHSRRDLALRELIAGALQESSLVADHFLRSMLLPRRDGRSPRYIAVSRLARNNFQGLAGDLPVAIGFISENGSATQIDTEALRALYLLTPAESRLVEGLATGSCLADLAEIQGLRIATLRDRLKSVYAKTGTRRQAALVALALAHRQ